MSGDNGQIGLKSAHKSVLIWAAALAGFSTLILAIALAILHFVGFNVEPFFPIWKLVPALSLTVMLFFSLKPVGNLTVSAIIQYLSSRPFFKSMAIFLGFLLIWAIARAITEWAVEPYIIDHGPCYSSSFLVGDSSPCGTIDARSEDRALAVGLVDKITAAIFIMLPFSLLSDNLRNWIVAR